MPVIIVSIVELNNLVVNCCAVSCGNSKVNYCSRLINSLDVLEAVDVVSQSEVLHSLVHHLYSELVLI